MVSNSFSLSALGNKPQPVIYLNNSTNSRSGEKESLRSISTQNPPLKSGCRPAAAFTLVELLVVISIIALLIALLIPALATAKRDAESIVCLTRLRTLGQLTLEYSDANNGFTPSTYVNNSTDPIWSDVLFDWYTSSPPLSVWYQWGGYIGAPGQKGVTARIMAKKFEALFWDPVRPIPITYPFGTSYASNPNGFGWDIVGQGSDPTGGVPPFIRISNFKNPTSLVAIGDSNQVFSNGSCWVAFNWWPSPSYFGALSSSAPLTQMIPPGAPGTETNFDYPNGGGTGLRYRHGNSTVSFTEPYLSTGTANVVFFDGHAAGIQAGTLRYYNCLNK